MKYQSLFSCKIRKMSSNCCLLNLLRKYLRLIYFIFYVPISDSRDILFLPSVCLFVDWTTLTLVITSELFEIEPLYLACRFLVTRASNLYKKF